MRTAAVFLAFLGWLAAGADENGNTLARLDGGGYAQCFDEMAGHARPAVEIRVCHVGNGSYVDYQKVLRTIIGRDWFPHGEFRGAVGEVRVVCSAKGGGADRLVFPALHERGQKIRVEVACQENAAAVERSLGLAGRILMTVARDRDHAAAEAARAVPGCQRKPASQECLAFRKLARDTFTGRGSARINGRPFSFGLRGFEIAAGLAGDSQGRNDELKSPDPVIRLRALFREKESIDPREWTRLTEEAFDKMAPSGKTAFVDRAVDDPDSAVRSWGLDHAEALDERRLAGVVNRALEDPDRELRGRAMRLVPRLGEFYMLRAMKDPDRALRMQALDTIVDYFDERGERAKCVPYLEKALNDPEELIRDMARAKLENLENAERGEGERSPATEKK